MAPKRTSGEGAGSQRKKAARTQPEESDDDREEQPTQGTQINMPDDERDRIAAEIGRYFLFHEHSKRGVTRADLRKAVLSEKGGHAGGRMLDYALEHARTKLKETFGMDIQLLKDSHAMDEESKKGPHGAAAENEPVETQAAKSANARLVLVNTLKHPRGMEPEVPKEEELYLALVLVTIGIIRHSDKRVSEKTLFTVLRTIGLNEQTRLARPFPPLEEVISKRMVKDMYLQYSKAGGPDNEKVLIEGPRAPVELNEDAWGALAEACKDQFAASQGTQPPEAQPRTQASGRRGRRSS